MDHIICHFEIPADDVPALARFYTDLFGWQIEATAGVVDHWTIRPASGNPHALGGGMMARQHPQQQPTNYVLVEDLDAYLARPRELGAKELVGKTEIPGMGWFCIITDPQHNCLGMFQQK